MVTASLMLKRLPATSNKTGREKSKWRKISIRSCCNNLIFLVFQYKAMSFEIALPYMIHWNHAQRPIMPRFLSIKPPFR
ncbi:hypothetical protein DYZ94_22720 [Klebsiella variicola]|nr:hypothetical protein CYD38_22370 [Klebsiella variicola]REI43815.1 hypothetical protein DYB09_23525 [Klebsiella variicola]REI46326.1 hypothetical protein DY002_23495 [Klebsiella variicola]REI60381.1 hypothetical protein DY007_22990 [Klebsiella variicola]REI63555.1 hypothetical protein DYZ94_22720 [Klebsiella variicola]